MKPGRSRPAAAVGGGPRLRWDDGQEHARALVAVNGDDGFSVIPEVYTGYVKFL
jgi:hypothetical protein